MNDQSVLAPETWKTYFDADRHVTGGIPARAWKIRVAAALLNSSARVGYCHCQVGMESWSVEDREICTKR